MQIANFKLSAAHDRGSVSCDELGPRVGNVRLMKRTLDEYGDEVWARDPDILNALLTAHYRCPIDLTGKIEGLQAVARALNKGDVTHACFVTIFLQFPNLPSFDDEAENQYDELLKSLRWSGLPPTRSGTRNIRARTSRLIEAGSHPYRRMKKLRLKTPEIGAGRPKK